MKKLQLTFNGKYITKHRIAVGRNCEVYLAGQLNTEYNRAVKLAVPLEQGKHPIEREAKIYRVMKGGVGFSELYWYGMENGYHAMVTDVYGPSLQQLLDYCDRKFTLKTTLLIIQQIIDRIELIHQRQFIYNNMDIENFLVGLGPKADKIYIVDLINCRKYVDSQGQHLPLANSPIDDQESLCPLRFRSIHSHIGKYTSRRDDLESFGYLMVYMLKGKLPWDELSQEELSPSMQTQQKKISTPPSLLCQGLPVEFERYFEYVRTLQFEEEPDYLWVRRLFSDLYLASSFIEDGVFDWASKHQYQ